MTAQTATSAASATNAQNAAQLGGQPASAYLRGGQDIAVGRVQSPQFRVSTPIRGTAGPLPISRTFTCGGGTLLIFASGSAYHVGSPGRIGMFVLVDGSGSSIGGYANEPASHKALVSGALTYDCAPGTHTITLSEVDFFETITTTNGIDFFEVTILELPFAG